MPATLWCDASFDFAQESEGVDRLEQYPLADPYPLAERSRSQPTLVFQQTNARADLRYY